MIIFTKKDKTIRKLFRQGKSYDEIATKTNCSFSQIKKIIDAEKQRIYHDKVALMHEEGKTYEEISKELGLTIQEIQIMISRHITSKFGDQLCQLYVKLSDSPIDGIEFMNLCLCLYQNGFAIEQLKELLSLKENESKMVEQYNNLYTHHIQLREANTSLEIKISNNTNFIQNQDDIIKAKENRIKYLDEEIKLKEAKINERETRLTKVNELDEKIKKNPSYIKSKKEFLEKLGNDEFVYQFANVLLELMFHNLCPVWIYYRPLNQYCKLSNISDFDTFCKKFPQLYYVLLKSFIDTIRRYEDAEKHLKSIQDSNNNQSQNGVTA